jgi:hypothetical protein
MSAGVKSGSSMGILDTVVNAGSRSGSFLRFGLTAFCIHRLFSALILSVLFAIFF